MIYAILFWEFFKIGLLAIGGGLVTVPFLYELAESYSWFSANELTNMIAVSESTPGPIGVNMATYAGFRVSGVMGGVVATLGLITPSLLIIIMLARYMKNNGLENVLKFVRPVVLALIISAGIFIAKETIINWWQLGIFITVFFLVHFVKKNPIFYILLGAIGGIVSGL